MADEKILDMETRDVNNLNEHVQISFEEIFGEPESVRSIDGVWRCSFKCYNCTLNCCYKVLTVLCAVPLAFCWACEFACLACYQVWYVGPYIRMCSISMVPCQKIMQIILSTFVSPCCESCGMFFSRINVKNG